MRRPRQSPRGAAFPPCKPVTVGVVIQCRHYREALVAALRISPDFILTDLGDGSAVEILERLLHLKPDVALVDMPANDTTLLIRETYRATPTIRSIAVNQSGDESAAVSLFEAGLTSYLDQSSSVGDVHTAIREVVAGELRCPPQITAALVRRLNEIGQRREACAGGTIISPKEAQVLPLLEIGLTNKEIAQRLAIEEATVKNHVHNILRKFGVHQRGEAVKLYRGEGPSLRLIRRERAGRPPQKGV